MISCVKEKESYLEVERQDKLKNGEWIGETDSITGILCKSNMIGFFKNMKINGDDIYSYTIVDSIKKENDRTEVLKTFLKWTNDYKDTVYYQLIQFDTTKFTIKNAKNKIEVFTRLTKEDWKTRKPIRKYKLTEYPSFKDSICDDDDIERCFKYDFKKYLTSVFDTSIVYQLNKSFDNITIDFILSKNGNVENIKVNTQIVELENEIIRVLKSLPPISPGTHQNKNVSIQYSIPCKYEVIKNDNYESKSFSFGFIHLEKVLGN
jgi:hypothetical protein